MDELVFSDGKHGRYDAHIGNELVAWARHAPRGNYICRLWVTPTRRRQGIATALVRHIVSARGKLNRCPSRLKNAAVHGLSARLGDELGEEFGK